MSQQHVCSLNLRDLPEGVCERLINALKEALEVMNQEDSVVVLRSVMEDNWGEEKGRISVKNALILKGMQVDFKFNWEATAAS